MLLWGGYGAWFLNQFGLKEIESGQLSGTASSSTCLSDIVFLTYKSF